MNVRELREALAEYPDDVPVTMDVDEGVVYSLRSTYALRPNDNRLGTQQVHYAPGGAAQREDRVVLSIEQPSEGDWR